ncbi:hypothetical protein SADUNF_Sadunf04G0043100 [Salix dunnii]|uniref:Uncharacterized protein n=1 Tax=Salix dunnii TaxID=1413687 RepID=A0A835KD23_9ROSI|nr:hypothetical protein SADUNF_Sadunf04G0043100 [Salix dunnii]
MVATASDDRVGDSIDSAGEPVADPFGATRRGRGFIVRKLVSLRNLIGGIFDYNRNLCGSDVLFGSLSKEDAVLGTILLCETALDYNALSFTALFEVAPLVAGYESESQTLALKIKGFREGDVPTSCLEVIVEQRYEYQPGAGIPETNDASIIPES